MELACTAQEYFTLCLADDSKFIEDYCAERKDTDLQVTGHSSKNCMYSNSALLWKLWRAAVLDASMSILLMTFFNHARLSSLMHTEGESFGRVCKIVWQVEQWRHVADKKGGMARMVTYRSLCHSPMCPPDTAVTVWQHVTFSDDKKVLVGCRSPSPHAYKHHAICCIVFFCASLNFVVL